MTRVLIVEREVGAAQSLAQMLSRRGFEPTVVLDWLGALADFDRAGTDIVLLDLLLPGAEGLTLCRELRNRGSVPIIMLTARDSEIDKIVGLEVGADDYVTKPYSIRELIARIGAVLRRCAPADRPPDTVLTAGPVTMNVDRHLVTVHDREVQLPLREFLLLHSLLAEKGRVVARADLMDRVWGENYAGATKTLDVHVKRLRAQIETDPAHPCRLVTVRGLGYMMDTGRDAAAWADRIPPGTVHVA